jgi:hypothetical protein
MLASVISDCAAQRIGGLAVHAFYRFKKRRFSGISDARWRVVAATGSAPMIAIPGTGRREWSSLRTREATDRPIRSGGFAARVFLRKIKMPATDAFAAALEMFSDS